MLVGLGRKVEKVSTHTENKHDIQTNLLVRLTKKIVCRSLVHWSWSSYRLVLGVKTVLRYSLQTERRCGVEEHAACETEGEEFEKDNGRAESSNHCGLGSSSHDEL